MHVQEPAAKSMWGIISPFCKILNHMDFYWNDWIFTCENSHNDNKCVHSFNMELFHVLILSNSNKFYNQCIAFSLLV